MNLKKKKMNDISKTSTIQRNKSNLQSLHFIQILIQIFVCSVFCTAAPSVLHGSHSGDTETFPVETVLKYSCFPGQASHITRNNTQWMELSIPGLSRLVSFSIHNESLKMIQFEKICKKFRYFHFSMAFLTISDINRHEKLTFKECPVSFR